MRPIDNISQMPPNLTDEEQIEFLETYGVSEEFWEQAEPVPEEERPRRAAGPMPPDLDYFAWKRLKDLADRRNVGYRTLLTQFVLERLYQEEVREGLFSGASVAEPTEPIVPPSTSVGKARDWQSWAYSFAKENEGLLDDPEVDSITLSRLAQNSSERLLELSGQIKRASRRPDFPATQLRRMMKGYDRLKALTEKAIDLYEVKFGSEDLQERRSDDPDPADIRAVLEEAERIRQEA